MGLVLETGLGVAGANTYNSLAEAETYFEEHPSAQWPTDEASQIENLLIGARILDGWGDWIGDAISTGGLLWGRNNAVGVRSGRDHSQTLPAELKEAHLEISAAYGRGDYLLVTPRETILEQVGPLKVEYAETSSATTQHPFIESLLSDFMVARRGRSTRLQRF